VITERQFYVVTDNLLSQNLEGAVAAEPEAVNGEVVVKGDRAVDAEALHRGEAGAIDNREGLVGKALADRPGRLEVGGNDVLDAGRPGANGGPEALGGRRPEAPLQKQPALDEDMVGGEQLLSLAGEQLTRPSAGAITIVGGRVEGR
jgi:hypothetical protein